MNLYKDRNKIIKLFEDKDIMPSNYALDEKFEPEEYDRVEEPRQKPDKSVVERTMLRRQKSNELNRMITENDEIISKELFKKKFQFQSLSDMQEKLRKTSNVQKNKELVRGTQSELFNLKSEIEKMFKDEINIEKPDVIVYTVDRILDVNNQNQEGKELKILTSQQMLSRLPISLAQLKAGNNSEKLKNEIRQLLYSLYRSKKLSKTI